MHSFNRVQLIARPPAEVFAFFSDVRHLAQITPPFLNLQWVTDPDLPIAEGALIEYRVRIHGLPFRWQTRITAFDPPRSFAYEQARGPCRVWEHDYRLEPVGAHTRLVDSMRYDLGWGLPGRLAHRLIVKRMLAAMFDHRRRRVAELLGPPMHD